MRLPLAMSLIGRARNALHSTLRLVARHVDGFFGAVAAFFTIGFFIAAAAIAVFAALASAVEVGFTQPIDEAVLRWFAEHRTPVLNQVMLEITTLGTGVVLIAIVLIASVFLWLTEHHWSVYVLLLGVLGAKLFNTLLKGSFARERPAMVEWVTEVHSASFPSGHAMSSIVVYGSVAYLVGRLEPSLRLKRITWLLVALIVAAIGISRMYLGVHYPSDVIGGFLAGLAWIALVATTMTAIRYFADRRPETRREEQDLDR
ncbi:MAG: phosphatase PAP2 family protein [Gemmatimonadota bacterium]